MKKTLAVVIACLLLVCGICLSKAAGDALNDIIAKLRATKPREIAYKFGTLKDLVLVPEQPGVILKCGDNPDKIKEIIIGMDAKFLCIYCIRASGAGSGGTSDTETLIGSMRAVGNSVAIGRWKIKDKKILLKFQLTDNEKLITQTYQQLKKEGKISTQGLKKEWTGEGK